MRHFVNIGTAGKHRRREPYTFLAISSNQSRRLVNIVKRTAAACNKCPINRDALQFLSELGRPLVETTGDVRASLFLVFIPTDFRCGATFQFGFAA